MRQGGRDLTEAELREVMTAIDEKPNKMTGQMGCHHIFDGLAGIDAENTAPYFDDALESLVQQHGFWARGFDIDGEYNRKDLRTLAIARALWAILVLNGYLPVGYNMDGNWPEYDEDVLRAETVRREEAWDQYQEVFGS